MKERTDSELFYLSWINKHGPPDEEAREREHPRWHALCESQFPLGSVSVSVLWTDLCGFQSTEDRILSNLPLSNDRTRSTTASSVSNLLHAICPHECQPRDLPSRRSETVSYGHNTGRQNAATHV